MKPLEWANGKLRFLDQTKLPLEEYYCVTDDVRVVADAIKRLAIRGAPLIGIAAAYGVVLGCHAPEGKPAGETKADVLGAITLLGSTRPTAVNLFRSLECQRRVLEAWSSGSVPDLREQLLAEARRIHAEDEEMCERISASGVELLPNISSILTHCNAGRLATGGRGTAVGIITKAWELGRLKRVYMNETRPLLQGARLTAWEMKKENIPATLITDHVAAVLMRHGKIDAVIVGADRIAMNGDVANKIGTYSNAVLAKQHGIPFYVAAPLSTIDRAMQDGTQIAIEERAAEEVTTWRGIRIAPEGIDVYAPAFDVTPNEFISAIVTDQGVFRPPYRESLRQLDPGKSHAH